MKRSLLTLGMVMLIGGLAQAATYTIDPMHSSISFKVKHVIGKVTGNFTKFNGTFDYDAGNPKNWTAKATIDPASINTGIEKRDTHLKSPDFFDVQKYPAMSFASTGVTDVSGSNAKLHGTLTMHGVAKPVTLDLTIDGVAPDPMGKGTRAGASAMGHVNRADFGIGATTGPMAGMVGTDIEIDIEVEGVSK
ncbi:MAG TPA: YceI family protein [Elusimicrobiota bacterium]|nr:YceI family protein [Elusimicrobiota bacterium]